MADVTIALKRFDQGGEARGNTDEQRTTQAAQGSQERLHAHYLLGGTVLLFRESLGFPQLAAGLRS